MERIKMDIEFKEITLQEKELIESYYAKEQSRSCEATFANNFLWAPHYEIGYAIVSNMLIFRLGGDQVAFSFPAGREHLQEAMEWIMSYFQKIDKPFRMTMVTEEQFQRLNELYPDEFQIEYDRDYADYIYEIDKMTTLSGKKLHGKRNHINKFKAMNPDWCYEDITQDNTQECLQMLEGWRVMNLCDSDPEKSKELCVSRNAVIHLKELGLVGGLLRAGGKVVAVTVGEPCNEDTIVVHIEKAFSDVQGAYPMINQQFLLHHAEHYQYVNREEDTGAEGLRKAKLSYYPCFLQEKGVVTRCE